MYLNKISNRYLFFPFTQYTNIILIVRQYITFGNIKIVRDYVNISILS